MSNGDQKYSELSAREFCAMTLRIPASGTKWLDDMIYSARYMDAHTRAHAEFVAQQWSSIQSTKLSDQADRATALVTNEQAGALENEVATLLEEGQPAAQDSLLLPEGEIAEFMRQRIEDGEWDAEDIPVRLARFGLMDPAQFRAEMAERIALRAEEAAE